MGMEQVVEFPPGKEPAWQTVRQVLAARGMTAQTCMIDGQLAFPDEEPLATWRELRIGLPGGMVTVRREPGRVLLIIWGNASPELIEARSILASAWSEAVNQ